MIFPFFLCLALLIIPPSLTLRCSAISAWCGADVGGSLVFPDIAGSMDLLGALVELASVATFLEHRHLTSPTLSAEVRRIMQCGPSDELTLRDSTLKGLTLKDMRCSVDVLSREMCSRMDSEALVALRVFVQQGGTQGSRSECSCFTYSIARPTGRDLTSL